MDCPTLRFKAVPTTGIKSLLPLTWTFRTQNPVVSLWKVMRSMMPVRVSVGAAAWTVSGIGLAVYHRACLSLIAERFLFMLSRIRQQKAVWEQAKHQLRPGTGQPIHPQEGVSKRCKRVKRCYNQFTTHPLTVRFSRMLLGRQAASGRLCHF